MRVLTAKIEPASFVLCRLANCNLYNSAKAPSMIPHVTPVYQIWRLRSQTFSSSKGSSRSELQNSYVYEFYIFEVNSRVLTFFSAVDECLTSEVNENVIIFYILLRNKGLSQILLPNLSIFTISLCLLNVDDFCQRKYKLFLVIFNSHFEMTPYAFRKKCQLHNHFNK